jgi:hypothetical protein
VQVAVRAIAVGKIADIDRVNECFAVRSFAVGLIVLRRWRFPGCMASPGNLHKARLQVSLSGPQLNISKLGERIREAKRGKLTFA